jgi:hypothetical protein
MTDDDTKLGNCPVCEEPWDMRRDPKDPEVWRFVGHNRPYLNKGKVINGIGCPGEGTTYEEAGGIKYRLDATGRQFPDDD